ncbi:MAG: transcription elongation factor GreA [Dehalococcoidia bacterium]|nr:MAG: transcription elongation factor GreA [Dehalococcoidia bacterium]
MAESVTASEALEHFAGSLANEPEKAETELPAVRDFVGWFGVGRPMTELRGGDVSTYVKSRVDGSLGDIEPLRAFLAYCSRLAFTPENLVPALGVGPQAGGARGGHGANAELGGAAFYVTLDGLRHIEEQLAAEKAKRPMIAQKLHDAMADKDFRENAPLDAARDEQGQLEARIRDLESRLRNAVIIDEQAKGGLANVGSVVKLINLATNREQTFTLVSATEVDPALGKISIQSPVGVAVMNRGTGDEVTVNAPSGPVLFRILDIQG